MEDIGGIIFYIIAAVIGIATQVGKKKRKAAKAASNKIVFDKDVESEMILEKEESVFQPIREEMLGDDYWAEEVKDDFVVSEDADPVKFLDFNNKKEGNYAQPLAEKFSKEGFSSITPVTEAPYVVSEYSYDQIEIKDDEIGNQRRIISEFSLEKAIIYSEILKRKYY